MIVIGIIMATASVVICLAAAKVGSDADDRAVEYWRRKKDAEKRDTVGRDGGGDQK